MRAGEHSQSLAACCTEPAGAVLEPLPGGEDEVELDG